MGLASLNVKLQIINRQPFPPKWFIDWCLAAYLSSLFRLTVSAVLVWLVTGLLGAAVLPRPAVLQPAVSTCSRVQSPAADWRLLQIRSGLAPSLQLQGTMTRDTAVLQSTRRPETSLQQVEDDISGINTRSSYPTNFWLLPLTWCFKR